MAGAVVGHVLDDVMPVLRANLQPHKDAEVRGKFFSLLSQLIVDAEQTVNSHDRYHTVSLSLQYDKRV